MKRKYPRATLRRIMRGKRKLNIGKKADIAMFLSLMLSLKKLAKAANAKAQETKETVLTDRHIKLVFADVLLSLKG